MIDGIVLDQPYTSCQRTAVDNGIRARGRWCLSRIWRRHEAEIAPQACSSARAAVNTGRPAPHARRKHSD